MDKKQIYVVAVVLVMAVAFIGVAVLVTNNNNNNGPITVTDSLGREVTVSENVDSIFCIGACSLRLVSYFDAVNDVCAIETSGTFNKSTDQTYYYVYEELFKSLNVCGTDAESVAALNPDVVITSTLSDVASADAYQEKCGCSVYVINADLEFDDEDFYDEIASLGELFGESSRATVLCDGIKSLISTIESNATTTSETAYACGMFYYGGASFLKGSGNYLPFDYSDVTNVMPSAENGQPYSIGLETLIDYDPDYMFIDGVNISSVISTINSDISSGTGLEDVTAIVDGNIYSTMIYKYYGTNWENQLINAYYVADVMGSDYSWSFEDKANEILQLFYGGMDVTYEDLAGIQGGCEKITL